MHSDSRHISQGSDMGFYKSLLWLKTTAILVIYEVSSATNTITQ